MQDLICPALFPNQFNNISEMASNFMCMNEALHSLPMRLFTLSLRLKEGCILSCPYLFPSYTCSLLSLVGPLPNLPTIYNFSRNKFHWKARREICSLRVEEQVPTAQQFQASWKLHRIPQSSRIYSLPFIIVNENTQEGKP